jgi:hypothetical protein
MTAPNFIQSATASGNGSATVTLNGVAAGNSILVAVTQAASGTRTYSAPNFTSEIANNGNGRVAAILRRFNVPAGTNSITVSANTGTLAISLTAIEVEPLELVATGSSTDPTSQTTHDSSSVGLDVSIDALLFGAGVLTASGGTVSPASGYSSVGIGTGQMVQYRRADAGVVADKATWSSTNARQGTNVLAAYRSPAGGGSIEATATIVEGADALTATASVPIEATTSIVEGADALTATANSGGGYSAGATIVDGPDALTATASVPIQSTATIVEGADALTATASVPIQSTATIVEGPDALTATTNSGGGYLAGATIVDGPDALTATASVRIQSTASIVEGADVVNATVTAGSSSAQQFDMNPFLDAEFSTLEVC